MENEKRLREIIIAGTPVFQDELINIPGFEVTDKTNLDAGIAALMLPLDKDPADGLYYSFELWVDTAGNIQKVITSKPDEQQVRDLLTKHFRITEPGYIRLAGKKLKVISKIKVKVNIAKRKAITAQEVILTKKEDKTYNIGFAKDHAASSAWQYDTFDNSASSYIPVLWDYMSKQEKTKIKNTTRLRYT